ncbi:MAG: DUF4330 domain-containing protein [bacterium]
MKKIIDGKGKLFGVINIVDFTVMALLVILLGATGIRSLSFFQERDENGEIISNEPETKDIYVTVSASSVVPEVAQTLNIGDNLVANGKFTTAEIVDLVITPAAYIGTTDSGELIYQEHPMWVDVVATIKDTIDVNPPIIRASEQEVRVNYNFYLKTHAFEATSRIRRVDIVDVDEEYVIEPITYDRIEQEMSNVNLFNNKIIK